MTFPGDQQHTVRLIKETAQIVDIVGEHVSLKRAGVNLKGLCPFHSEKTPSFIVNPDRQTFHCFGCGEGGDVFSFMMKFHRLTFPEAMKELAQRYHIELPEKTYSTEEKVLAEKRQILFDLNQRAAESYHEFLMKDAQAAPARDYLKKRGINDEAIRHYKLGYAPDKWDFLIQRCGRAKVRLEDIEEAGLIVKRDRGGYYDRFRNRVLFPIFEMTGKIVGFGGRILGEGEPKYLNSPETPIFNKSRILYGLYHHKETIRRLKRVVIVEGNFDLLSLAVNGIDYGAAPLGTALTRDQVRRLKGFADEAILLFDGDAAGLKAAMRTVPIFLAEQVQAKVVILPEKHDPDTFIREYGQDVLEQHLDNAMPLPEFVLEQLIKIYGVTLEGKSKILQELQPIVADVRHNPLQRSVLISKFCDRLELDVGQVENAFAASGKLDVKASSAESRTGMDLPHAQKQLLEFIIIHPEFLQRFIDSGIEEVLVEPGARTILEHMKKMRETADGSISPEMLLDTLPEGIERSYVTRLLITAQTYDEEDKDILPAEMAAEKLAWLNQARLKKEIEAISHEIKKASAEKNEELLLELSLKKIELNRNLKASLAGVNT